MSGPRPTMSRRDAHWRHYTVRRMAFLLLSGLALAAGATDAALAQSVSAARTVAGDPHAAFVTEASQRFGIPEHWIVAVKRAESAGDVRAISSAGALGLMQVMPDTWAALRVRYGLGRDPYDPRDNILAGAAYLREMFDRYRTIPAMLGAYNAGPGRYDEYVQTGRALPAETRAYIALLAPQQGERIADMFCGLGNFTLPIARSGAQVVGIEGSAELVRRATENAAHNGLAGQVEYAESNLFTMTPEALAALGFFDRMLIDPPREGAVELVKSIGENGPWRIVYVSCNPATLARDAAILVHQKGYRLKGAGVVNMFPNTSHVESIALFDRA